MTFELCLSSAIAEIMLQNELLDHQVRFNDEGFKEIVTFIVLSRDATIPFFQNSIRRYGSDTAHYILIILEFIYFCVDLIITHLCVKHNLLNIDNLNI